MKKYHTGKLKYGSISALMIVMVLAALIALNAGVYALEKNKGQIASAIRGEIDDATR